MLKSKNFAVKIKYISYVALENHKMNILEYMSSYLHKFYSSMDYLKYPF